MGAYVDVEVSGILSLHRLMTLIPGAAVLQGRLQCLCHILSSVSVRERVREMCHCTCLSVCQYVNVLSVVTNVQLENK